MATYYKLLKEDGDYLLLETEDKILLENYFFVTWTIGAKARIQKSRTKTLTAKADIKASQIETVTAKSCFKTLCLKNNISNF